MSTRLAVAALGVLSLGIIALTVLGVLAYIDLHDRVYAAESSVNDLGSTVYAAESSVNDLSSTVYENSNAVYTKLAQLDNLEYQMLDLEDDLEGMQSQVNGIKVLWEEWVPFIEEDEPALRVRDEMIEMFFEWQYEFFMLLDEHGISAFGMLDTYNGESE